MLTPATRAVTGGCALGLAVGWNVGNLAPIATSLASDYGVSLATIGLMTTALFVVHLLMQVPGGRSSDRFGPRRSGFAGLAVLVVANAVALIAPDPGLALACRAVMGVGTGLGFVAASDYIRTHGGSPFAQGLYGGIAVGAGGIAIVVVPPVADVIGWRAPYATAIAVALLGALVLAAGPADTRRGTRRSAVHARLGTLLRDPRLLRLAGSQIVSFGLSVVIGNWTVTLLEHHGYTKAEAVPIGSLALLMGIVSRPLGGWLGRHHPALVRPFIAGSYVAGALGTLLLAVSGPVALATLGGLLVGLAAGIPFASLFTGAARARPEAPATAVGIVNGAGSLMIVAATPVVGLTFSLGTQGRLAFAAMAAIWIAALLVLPTRGDLGEVPVSAPLEEGAPGG